jgi:hypothetical protein
MDSEHGMDASEPRAPEAGHGAARIQAWLDDLVALARSGEDFTTSAGAEPDRDYAYLEFHDGDGRHSILVFSLRHSPDGVLIRSDRFDGDAVSVRRQVDALVHQRDSDARSR